jgi:hypothetical protein
MVGAKVRLFMLFSNSLMENSITIPLSKTRGDFCAFVNLVHGDFKKR